MFAPLNVRLINLIGFQVPDQVITVISCAIVYLTVVGCCNATNLMDGLDGLCGGVTAVIAAGFLFLTVSIAQKCSTQLARIHHTTHTTNFSVQCHKFFSTLNTFNVFMG